ncbi:glycosyltransferase [Thermoanaerobacterium sp. RBIITD]|uniref:glycosyltransferase n=1 Tax=Thermoanaerobacterium sp. RBIITD TaxID=1550240 RepID=UPI000BB80908|nr:glycosyltransferase [Thermoanaerobacterium sp. RBIITD]SNX53120.1 Glycosyltransferase involved in cell wall bisynthesis [Thermoanaerobacterium sp. RBIITD]
MNLKFKLSNNFDKYQLYDTIPNIDWELFSVNVHILNNQMFFDLLLFSEKSNKLVPIFLNTLNDYDEIEIPSMLISIDNNTLNKVYLEAVNIISSKKSIRQPNDIFFTDLLSKVDVLRANINPQRRPIVGLNDYMNTIKFICNYTHIRQIIEDFEKGNYNKKYKILDCGCGCGYGSIILGGLPNSQVIGADIDNEAVTLANLINIERKNVSYVKSSFEGLRDKGYKFDCIVSLETLEHVEAPEKFVKDALKLLNNDGLLIVSIPHWRYHGTDLNSDHVANWSIEKGKKFFSKLFTRYKFFVTEVVDLKDVLNSTFDFKEVNECNYKKVEHMFFICNKRDIKIDNQVVSISRKQKLRILFVNHSIPPYEYTGTPIATYMEMRSLQKLGHETAVLIPNKGTSVGPIKEFVNNITIYKVPSLSWGQTFLEDAYFGYNIRNYLSIVEDVIKDFSPDIVHINDYVFMSAKIIELFEAIGLPMVRFVHAMEELCFRTHPFYKDELCNGPETPIKCAKCILKDNYNRNNVFRLRNESNYLCKINARFEYINYLYSKYDAILFMTDKWKEYISKFIKYDKTKSFIVPLGINLSVKREEQIKKTNDVINFVYIGTMAKVKGANLLLDVFSDKEILEKNFTLNIFGVAEDDLQSKIRDVEVISKGKIRYMGPYKKENLSLLLDKKDMGIMPSYSETYSITTRELLYVGIPSIVSDIYGIADIVKDGYNGLVFKTGDFQGLKQKVMMVLKDKSLIDKLKEGAINTSIPTPEDEAKQLENIYLNILSSD